MSGDVTAAETCLCDPSFADRFTEAQCLRDACTAYHAITCVMFGIVTLYIARVLWCAVKASSKVRQVKNIVLFVLVIFCFLRSLRGGLLSGSEPRESLSSGFNLFLRLLYALPPVLAFVAWSLLAFVWIRMYNFVRDPMSLRNNGIFKLNRWLVAYAVVCAVLSTGWFIIVIEYSVNETQGIINYYSAAVLLLLNIAFALSGWRFARTLKESASVNPSKLKMFKQVQKFVLATTAEFWVMFFVFVIFPFVTEKVETAAWFLTRHYIYRFIEGATVVTMALTYTPTWRELFFVKKQEVFNGFSTEMDTRHSINHSATVSSMTALNRTNSEDLSASSTPLQGSPMEAGVELP